MLRILARTFQKYIMVLKADSFYEVPKEDSVTVKNMPLIAN